MESCNFENLEPVVFRVKDTEYVTNILTTARIQHEIYSAVEEKLMLSDVFSKYVKSAKENLDEDAGNYTFWNEVLGNITKCIDLGMPNTSEYTRKYIGILKKRNAEIINATPYLGYVLKITKSEIKNLIAWSNSACTIIDIFNENTRLKSLLEEAAKSIKNLSRISLVYRLAMENLELELLAVESPGELFGRLENYISIIKQRMNIKNG